MKAIVCKGNTTSTVEVSKPTISRSQCLIRVHYAGVNRADLLQIKGLYPPPAGASEILGLEFSGEVVAIGSDVNVFYIGDQVCSIVASGAYAEYVVVESQHLIKVPSNIDLKDAAAIPEAFITAYQSIVKLADVTAGEKVLIHAGASGVGAAAIQVAKKIGAEVIVTASKAKHPFCKELGADQCIDYKSVDFDEVVSNVDIVLDLIGGSYFKMNINVLAVEGRMIMLGFLGGVKAMETNVSGIVTKRLRIEGSTLRSRSMLYKAQLIRSFTTDFMDDEIFPFKTNVDCVFDWGDFAEAHSYMEGNKNRGKILLKIV